MSPYLDPEISVGHLLTAFAVLLSALGLLFSWSRDRRLKRREYADRIRQAAGFVTAKLRRWVSISMSLFERIQPIFTDADRMVADKGDLVAARDFLWRELVRVCAEVSSDRMQEAIEIAYVDLFGYEPVTQRLVEEAVFVLSEMDVQMRDALIERTQEEVLALHEEPSLHSALLGNKLRETAGVIEADFLEMMGSVLGAVGAELISLAQASDRAIESRVARVAPPEEVLAEVVATLEERRVAMAEAEGDIRDGDHRRGL